MSMPKNNLDDMRKKAGLLEPALNPAASDDGQPALSKAKFRAARTAAPATPVRSFTLPTTTTVHAPTNLSSSSSSVNTTRRPPASRDFPRPRTPVSVSSSESSPASYSHASIPAKRSSPHSTYNPPSKRPKSSPRKENLYQASLKGKTPIRQIDFSRVPPPLTPGAHSSQSSSQPQHYVSTGLTSQSNVRRLLELDYSAVSNLSVKELADLMQDSNKLNDQCLWALMEMSESSRKILAQLLLPFKDLSSWAAEVIKARSTGESPVLPQSDWINHPSTPGRPLQPLAMLPTPTNSSMDYSSSRMPAPHPPSTLRIDPLPTPSATFHNTRNTEDQQMATGPAPDSDDDLWQNMDDFIEDDLNFDRAPLAQAMPFSEPEHDPVDDAPSTLLPSPAIATPPSSEQMTNTSAFSLDHYSSVPGAPSPATSNTVSTKYYTPEPALGSSSSAQDLTKSMHYADLVSLLRTTFSLHAFRPNQLAAITACMDGKDAFVLMPTGGGKSLCFQLPALLKHRRRNAVTFVVTPLRSLMTDQVNALLARGVPTVMVHGNMTAEERQDTFKSLLDTRKGVRPCLAYVTPELLDQSGRMRDTLRRLADTDSIAGFVADEAHCISSWGRSFRQSYLLLSSLREDYPSVPIMALTATANRTAIQDIIDKLKIPDCVRFVMSFNRPNLSYTVSTKTSDQAALQELAAWIKERHPGKTGIVYCGSRKKCEKAAQDLRDKFQLLAEHYHAEVSPDEKIRIQADWQAGRLKIIVATIAFGMGIDKPDVRFVAHLHLPMSLSNYYQETGRAGRDGLPADCRLYYAFRDAIFPLQRAREEPGTKENQDAAVAEIQRVLEYCQNDVDCRRTQVLSFFGEQFDPAECHGTCDNCANDGEVVNQDLTTAAADMVRLVKELNGKATRIQLIEAYIDKKSSKFPDQQHSGCGRDIPQHLAERLFDHLVCIGVVSLEVNKKNGGQWSNSYAQVEPQRARQFLRDGEKVLLRYKPRPTKKRGKKTKERTESQSTAPSVSQAGSSRAPPSVQPSAPVIELPDDPIDDIDPDEAMSFWQVDDDPYADDVSQAGPSISKLPSTVTMRSAPQAGPSKPKPKPKPRPLPLFQGSDDSDDEIEVVAVRSTQKNITKDGDKNKTPADDGVEEDQWNAHYQALKRHRDKLEDEQGYRIRDLFGDEELGVISSVLPSDVQEYKQQLQGFGVDISSPNVRFIPSFLEVIMPFRAASQPPPSPRQRAMPTMSQLHKQYDYQGGSSSKPNSKR